MALSFVITSHPEGSGVSLASVEIRAECQAPGPQVETVQVELPGRVQPDVLLGRYGGRWPSVVVLATIGPEIVGVQDRFRLQVLPEAAPSDVGAEHPVLREPLHDGDIDAEVALGSRPGGSAPVARRLLESVSR